MSKKLSEKSGIRKILVVSLTNIGDVVLTFPVIDILRNDFPLAKLSVVIGPKAETLMGGNPQFDQVHIFDKHQSIWASYAWIRALRKERFDLVVDLRNTAIPLFLWPKYRTTFRAKRGNGIHMKDKHLNRLRSLYHFENKDYPPVALFISDEDQKTADDIISRRIGPSADFMVVAPGAADTSKRWPEEKFAAVCDHWNRKQGLQAVFIGDDGDRPCVEKISASMTTKGINLCGATNLVQAAALFKRCRFALVNDSAPMHIASYLDIPVLALFGPTDPALYGPWSRQSRFIRKSQSMSAIDVDDVLNCVDFKRPEGTVAFHHA